MEIVIGLIVTVVFIALALALLMFVANRKQWHGWKELHQHHVLESHLVKARWLLSWRAFCFVYCVVIWIYTLAVSGNKGGFFSFYTIWNYSMLTVYFGSATFYTLSHRNVHTPTPVELFWRRSIWVLFEICLVMATLVDAVTWAILYPQSVRDDNTDLVLNVSSYHIHALNFVFILVDGIMNNFVFMPSHSLFVCLWGFAYAMFAWAYYAGTGVWNYSFLDTSKSVAPLWYIGLLIGHAALFLLFWLVVRKLKAPRLTVYETPSDLTMPLTAEREAE
ncbi:hypothetical protein CAOG_05392 [Capsaspora owczarzaki ATCC 30864]|uniref:FAR-17a/AIG1-like protein n=1 Tax=Capsaspora owczarzaki (strain ATCC 30864) TaxID=595528 RepID=A0A0D2X3S4_CAPO3|nr:hypothetical protein CAOG_05392 [Capsaspora owczarzaki ATCC 30864]KJE94814.1 hypothetical protein CAOG_005392 [Capsaspora owczarzaki ATCC 30864]|eukprot:XP_004347077.2 hypothetical protein CAOG_05392 [Capsaspora owczarzaki ATCC 30864]